MSHGVKSSLLLATRSWSWLIEATQAKWTAIYLRILAGILFYGATVHIGNMLGLSGQPWRSTPLLWRSLDVLLLIFNVIVGIGLWQRKAWAAVAFILGILLLQILPYTLFRQQFIQTLADVQTLNGLIGTEVLLILGLIIVIITAHRFGKST